MSKGNNCRFLVKHKELMRIFAVMIIFLQVFGLLIPGYQGMTRVYAGEGTSESPYTVAEAIANNSGTGKVVEGYIVGTTLATNSYDFEAPFTSNTNIAIADSPDERNASMIMPVQLPSGDIRIALNLVSNEGNLGKKVKLTGTLTAYFTVPGLKTLTAYEFVNEGADTTAPEIIHTAVTSGIIGSPIEISAKINDASNVSAVVYYGGTPDGNGFTDQVEMVNDSGNDYTANITPDKEGNLYYYIKATDEEGNTSTLPESITECYCIEVTENDTEAPVITHTQITEATVGVKVDITATVTDMSAFDVKLFYRAVGDATYKGVDMVKGNADTYTASIPDSDVTTAGIEYYIEASDSHNNKSTAGVFTIPVSSIPTIAEARSKAQGTVVTVQGIVTYIDGTNYYMQDDTAAIDLYKSGLSLKVGDLVKVTGKLSDYKGLMEIIPSSVADAAVVSSDNVLPAPKVVTIPDINDSIESQLVKIKNVTLGTINTTGNTPITDSSNQTINIFKIPALTDIAAGDKVNVTAIVSQYNSFQLRVRTAADVEKAAAEPDTTPPAIILTPVTQGNMGVDLTIKAAVSDDRQVTGVKLYYRVKGQAGFTSMDMTLENNEYSAVIPKASLSTAGMEYYIEASDGTNTITSPVDTSKPYEVAISAADISAPEISELNPGADSSGNAARPVISAKFTDASAIDLATVKLSVDGTDVTGKTIMTVSGVNYTPSEDLANGEHIVKLEVSDIYANKAEKIWSFTVGEIVYNLYFGQLHSHTTYSDGLGTVDDAYSYAKTHAKVDFLAVTDHSNSFDNASTCTIADGSKSTEWNDGHAAADKYTDASFVGIYGYEMTWSNGTGHINTFNTAGFENRETAKYKNADGLKQYYDVLKQVPVSISQLNHPGPTFGDFNDFAYYDPDIDRQISLIEVGNGEGAVGSKNYFPSYEYYTRALDKGWHVSPTNNQDNHLGKWGDANTAKTVILATDLTRDKLYDGMRNMHTYATEDQNLRIKYTLNGRIMGSIFDQKPGSVDIKVDLEDPDKEALGKVTVISNGGKEVATQELTSSKDTVEFNLEPNYSYYYIRVDEADGDIAVTAPVWIGEVEKAGISKTMVSTTMPIKGESLKITTSLFNNETVPMVIQSLTYSITGDTINSAPVLADVSPLSTGSYSFDYTPEEAGKFNVDVKLVASINGVEKIFTDVLKLDVTDPVLVTKVVADGSHYNDYVNGYYANNLGNFTAIANSEKIAVNVEKTKLTDDVLKDVKLLIISAPAKKSGTANGVSYQPQAFSDEDIAVIKRYVDNGGSLMVCGIADYQDGAGDYQTSTQMNKLLEAIGATSRFNNDEVIDNTQKLNNQNFRLAFDDYNMDSPYLNGVQTGQTYSFYSGCSLNLDQAAMDSGKVVWLVKGHDTTESIDSNNKLPGVALPKGSVYALAVEKLNGGGRMFIGGTVYISDFEVKAQMDNSTQLQNSNYNITMNILDSIKKEMPVTQISQVRAAEKGSVYCVEGTVTAGRSVPDNTFFDTLYIQDETGGINIFPVSGNDISVGQKVRVIGTVDEYLGDKELRVISLKVTDTAINPVEPTLMETGDAMKPENGGMLIRVEGKVKSMDSQNLYIDDGSGTARVFVDGYIGDGSNDPAKAGKWDSRIKIGDTVTAVGLASQDPNGHRLRVRSTAEIMRVFSAVSGISLDKTTASIAVGSTLSLLATVTPADATHKSVVWRSSDDTVASVISGIVTGKKAGTATITATTNDGNYTASCVVTVNSVPSHNGGNDRDHGSGDNNGGQQPVTQAPAPPVQQLPQPPAPPPVQTPPPPAPGGILNPPQQVTVQVPDSAIVITQGQGGVLVQVNGTELLNAAGLAQSQASAASNPSAPVVAISLPASGSGQNNIVLPGNAVYSLIQTSTTLQINLGGSLIQLPPAVMQSFPNGRDTTITIRSAAPSEITHPLPEGMSPVGQGLEFNLGLQGGAGGNIMFEMSVPNGSNINRYGIYYYDEATGSLEFVGGRISNGRIIGFTDHNSKYFVMEYNKKFKDVKAGEWYTEFVESMAAKHVINGNTDNTFEGERDITRAEAMVYIARALQLKPTEYKNGFRDISSKDYYAGYIQTLCDMGIAKGAAKDMFKPNEPITREEMFSIIGRLLEKLEGTDLKAYSDYKDFSGWALEPVGKAVASGIIMGSGNKLRPKDKLTRYEAAAIMYRLYNYR